MDRRKFLGRGLIVAGSGLVGLGLFIPNMGVYTTNKGKHSCRGLRKAQKHLREAGHQAEKTLAPVGVTVFSPRIYVRSKTYGDIKHTKDPIGGKMAFDSLHYNNKGGKYLAYGYGLTFDYCPFCGKKLGK